MNRRAMIPEPARIVIGKGAAATGAHMTLAIVIYDFARGRGLARVKIDTSRSPGSISHYVSFRDALDRRWIIRVSNHRRPRRTSHEVPHLDLVSIDGISGAVEACAYVDAVIAGGRTWFDPEATIRRLKPRRG